MIKLLSTDFDGTLVDHFATPPVVPELFEALAELRSRGVLGR
jgi:hydroxymethylpyrimidine pyrophosphatase-like HAD family hydrolase